MNPYIGHDFQVSGIEEHRLVGGKGDGMRLFEINNGCGLELTLSPDRAGDLTRVKFRGINLSYMSPCGYVAPAYYDRTDAHWLESFTAGFLTTCGLQNAGVACEDGGNTYPMHGTIANQPCEQAYWTQEGDDLVVHTLVKDETIFAAKLRMARKITVSTKANTFEICDTITNTGDREEPFLVLYHMNMGYPLLDEDSILTIPAQKVTPRDAHAANDAENWMHMEKPTAGYQERCYFHELQGMAHVKLCQPKLNLTLHMEYDAQDLDCFTQWKMIGVRDYVLGLEPGNCYPDGRAAMGEQGRLKTLQPGESKTYRIRIWLEG